MRLRYIDYTKGFAIILMLFGHTMTAINSVHIWIYSFHMPIFFIICGILMHRKEAQRKIGDSVRKIIIHRLRITAVPYYVFGSILVIFYTLLNIIGNKPNSFGKGMFDLLTLQGIDSLWFLPIYILAEIIMELIGKRGGIWKKLRFVMVLCAFFVVSILSDYMTVWYWDLLYKILLGICFIEIGLLCSTYSIIERMPIGADYILLTIGLLLAETNGPVEMTASKIGNPIVYFWGAMATSIAVMSLLKKIEDKQLKLLEILGVYGKNSIVVLCTNNLFIEIIRLLDYKIAGNFLISIDMIGCIIFIVILMVIEWYCIKLSNGIFSPIFGRNRKVFVVK